MHYYTIFQERNLKKIFWGGAQPLSRRLPTGEGETPPQTPPLRLLRLDRRAFGAPHLALPALGFMRPVFSVPIVGNPNCD